MTSPLLDPPHAGTASGPDQAGVRPAARWWGWREGVLRPAGIYAASRLVVLAGLWAAMPISHVSLRDELAGWDGRWFLSATQGWPAVLPMVHGHVAKSAEAFFPVLPLLMRALVALTPLTPVGAGLVVSWLSGLTAMVAVWLLVRSYAGRPAADRGVVVLALFPGSLIFSLIYAEGLVITLAALSLLALQHRRWLWAGLLGAAATATAPIALALVASGAWCAVACWRSDRSLRPLLAPVLTPLGSVAYVAWLRAHTGTWSALTATERQGWHSYLSAAYPLHLLWRLCTDPGGQTATGRILLGCTALTVVCAVVAVRQRLPAPVLVYGLVVALLAMCTAPVGVRPRLLLDAFPLLVAVGTALRGRWLAVVAAASRAGPARLVGVHRRHLRHVPLIAPHRTAPHRTAGAGRASGRPRQRATTKGRSPGWETPEGWDSAAAFPSSEMRSSRAIRM